MSDCGHIEKKKKTRPINNFSSPMTITITVGVLALQGAFYEHIKLLRQAVLQLKNEAKWDVIEVRTVQELEKCDALIIPGGESTTVSLVAARSNLLEPLRDFVKYERRICQRRKKLR